MIAPGIVMPPAPLQLATADQVTPWTAASLEPNWATYNALASLPPATCYRKIGRRVQVILCVTWTAVSSGVEKVFTLPAGYRPAHTLAYAAQQNLYVTTGGLVIYGADDATRPGEVLISPSHNNKYFVAWIEFEISAGDA